MQPDYATVVDPASLISSGVPLLIHTFFVALQVLVFGLLLVHGTARAIDPESKNRVFAWLAGRSITGPFGSSSRVGGLAMAGSSIRAGGLAMIGFSFCVVAPIAVGAPAAVSVLGLLGAIGSGLMEGRDGTRLRRTLVVCAVLVLAFLTWEGRDPAAQTRAIATKAMDWRSQEIRWQLRHDANSPKVGDLAPDFELQDPAGVHSVRLATFRGKRPVALVFGSYT